MLLLKQARKAMGLSAKRAARELGVHVQTWLGYEAGKFAPSWALLRRVRRQFGVDLNALAEECDRAEGLLAQAEADVTIEHAPAGVA